MMLQGICLKVEFVEFVIQIQKKAAGLASEAEARRREAWAGTDRFLLGLGFHLYKYLCKPQEIKNQVVSLLRSKKKHPKIVRLLLAGARGFSPSL